MPVKAASSKVSSAKEQARTNVASTFLEDEKLLSMCHRLVLSILTVADEAGTHSTMDW